MTKVRIAETVLAKNIKVTEPNNASKIISIMKVQTVDQPKHQSSSRWPGQKITRRNLRCPYLPDVTNSYLY
jgi:hypothetical protein